MIYNSLLKPLLFQLDAEYAHTLTHRFAEMASQNSVLEQLARGIYSYQTPELEQQIWGLPFRNPIGLAAGFDKNGEIPEVMEALGFGFVEIGSITQQPSTGNPKPRAFRLPKDRALINRMGLNNDGAQTIIKRLKNKNLSIPLGINIAKTHDSNIMGEAAIKDYVYSFTKAKEIADYITINISCPNTTEGNTFEDPKTLAKLLSALNIREDARTVPTVVKFSADLTKPQLIELLGICEQHRIHGYMTCNTSSQRDGLSTNRSTLKQIGCGGLSGHPLAPKSVQMISWISEATKGQKPIIGVGGIDSFDTALKMLLAGADLLQVYTGLIYEGPGLVKSINKQLANHIGELNISSIHQLAAASK